MPDFVADRIVDAKLADDSTSVAISLAAGPDVVTLRLDIRLVSELIDTVSALNDEAMRRRAAQSPGMQAGAFRRCQNARVNIDATLTALLLEFDPDARHRVGVAIPIDRAQPLARQLELHAKKAKKLDRKQRRQ